MLTGVLIQETRLSFDLKALEEKACAFCKLDYAGTHLLPTACMREPSTFAGLAGQRVRAGLESFALLPSEIHFVNDGDLAGAVRHAGLAGSQWRLL